MRTKASEARRHSARAAEKRAAIADHKLERGCVDCGYNAASEALDLDHVRGEKLFTPATLPQKPWAAIYEEMSKCEVRCANCHRIRSRKNWAADHERNFVHAR